ncbi:hypothetical protein KAX08_01905 [candidate division WOR-3 bacterium]|nr:hypothetical protein [candidate division WOR-3 bacterium]
MDIKSLKELVSEKFWQECSERLKNKEVVEVLHKLFDYIVNTLSTRIDGIKTEDGKAISFFSQGREFLTINVTRKNLRIYIHPPAGAFFEPEAKFGVEEFRFCEGSFRKSTGKYKGLSVWISEKKYLPGVKEIINHIPKTI